jgi:hypothetical protein
MKKLTLMISGNSTTKIVSVLSVAITNILMILLAMIQIQLIVQLAASLPEQSHAKLA